MTEKTREQYRADIRYAIILCERTARLYRRLGTAGVFLTILGGSAFLLTLPDGIKTAGMTLFALSGAALLAIRPAEKIANNDADVKRYRDLMVKSNTLSLEQLAIAIDEAGRSDAQEVEPLRYVAYNQMVMENNRPDVLIPLSFGQRFLAKLA
jgi:hypothetical protein